MLRHNKFYDNSDLVILVLAHLFYWNITYLFFDAYAVTYFEY